MLVASEASAALVVCTTCRSTKDSRQDVDGRCGGERLLQALQLALIGHPAEGALALQAMACLFACTSGCAVHIRAPGKMGYLLGGVSPTPGDATALLDYAAAHLRSRDGVVAFAEWPEGVKGRFIARLPPEGYIWAPDRAS